jgi:mono/diheme cytochrome c family protein
MRLVAVSILLTAMAGFALAQQTAPVFTDAQAQRGAKSYTDNCASCHGDKLDNGEGDGAPALVGASFTQQWGGKSVGDFLSYTVQNMPANSPASLSPGAYVDIVAYILSKNGVAAGAAELPSDSAKLATTAMPH